MVFFLPLQCAGFLPNDPDYAALLREARVDVPALFIIGQADALIPPSRTQVGGWRGWGMIAAAGTGTKACLRVAGVARVAVYVFSPCASTVQQWPGSIPCTTQQDTGGWGQGGWNARLAAKQQGKASMQWLAQAVPLVFAVLRLCMAASRQYGFSMLSQEHGVGMWRLAAVEWW
jgi:hypothetical protein